MSIYIQIQGIEGNVTAQGLQGYIELESFNFDVKRALSTRPGVSSDREGTHPSVSEIVVTKRVDKTTPQLFSEATTGTAISQAVIKFVNTGSDLSEYLNITINNVMISGYDLVDDLPTENASGTMSKRKPTEKIRLNFDKIEVRYTPYDQNHKAGSSIASGYDLSTAKAA